MARAKEIQAMKRALEERKAAKEAMINSLTKPKPKREQDAATRQLIETARNVNEMGKKFFNRWPAL